MTTVTFRLSDVAELITKGTTPPKSMGGFSDAGVNYIKSESLSYSGAVDISNLVKVSPEVHQKLKRSQLKEEDILYSIAGANLGKCGIVPSEILPANTNQAVAIIRLDKTKADARFVSFFLRNPRFVRSVLAGVAQSAQPNVNLADIGRYELPAFGLPRQKAIGDALGALDDKIELNRRMNETLEELARALFRDWFVDFGPTRRQMEGATSPAAIMGQAFPPEKAATLAPLFPAKLGDDGLPEGWSKQPVGELAEIVGGGTPKTKTEEFWEGGTHLWATPRDLSKLSGVFIGDTERKLTDAGLAKVSSGLSPKGSVLMSSRAPIGYLAIASQPVAVNQGFIVMRPTGKFPTHFAKLWCEANMETIEANANGSTFQEISKKNFKPILATVASVGVMAAFSDVAGLLFGKVQANEQENQTLAEMRDLLLPKLMSGEIRLTDAEAAL